jgi:hypothetical protein
VADETNGDKKGRLERVEELLAVLANDHLQFRDEHRQLLKAQVLLYDSVQKIDDSVQNLYGVVEQIGEAQKTTELRLAELATAQAQLAASQQHTDEQMSALIRIVDDLIRRPPA